MIGGVSGLGNRRCSGSLCDDRGPCFPSLGYGFVACRRRNRVHEFEVVYLGRQCWGWSLAL